MTTSQTTTDLINTTTTSTEVLPEAMNDTTFDSGVTSAELVVIGAGITVGILAVSAILLRLIMPLVRKSYQKNRMLSKEPIEDDKNRHLFAPSTPSSMMSRSSRSSSRTGEWSDSGSDRTKTTYASEANLIPQNSSYGNLRAQKLVYPMYLPESNSASIADADRLNDDLISVISTNSLEAANFGDAYRQNWDQTFDPYLQSDSSLSYVSHPSENRKIPDKTSEWYASESPMRRDWERSQMNGGLYRHDIMPTKLTKL
ncbi:hypothetical protein SNE40_013310 [Patella caerulea]